MITQLKSKKPDELPDFGQQYMAKGPIGPLLGRLITGEIDEAEYERLRADMPWWRRIWEEEAETFFGVTAFIAIMLWLVFWR